MKSAFPQFDLANLVRCPESNEEGFRCGLRPSHGGSHLWDRCNHVDAEGHRCGLDTRHAGRHEPPWYDMSVPIGSRHEITYGGTKREVEALADTVARFTGPYGWIVAGREFKPSWPFRIRLLAPFLAAIEPRGSLRIVFVHRGRVAPAGA
jgi:hypothetical protein